jgi:hypothetical protein
MTGHGSKFPRKIEAAIAALLSRPSIQDAAHVAGVDEKTLRRWLQDPEFKAQYLQARREVVVQSTARLQQATGPAGTTILKLMTDPSQPGAVRLRAALAVFELAIKGVEVEDIDARVTALEDAGDASKKRK